MSNQIKIDILQDIVDCLNNSGSFTNDRIRVSDLVSKLKERISFYSRNSFPQKDTSYHILCEKDYLKYEKYKSAVNRAYIMISNLYNTPLSDKDCIDCDSRLLSIRNQLKELIDEN